MAQHYSLYGYKKRTNIKLSILALGLAFAVTLVMTLLAPASAATNTVVVTGNTVTSNVENGSEGWWFNRDQKTKTPYQFTNDESTIGTGSLYVLPIENNYTDEANKLGNDKFIAENFVWQDIADVKSISYDYQIAGNGTSSDANEFYMNVYMNFGQSADDKYYDCKYDVIPTVGSRDGFTTVTFDPTLSYPVTTRGGNSASPFTCPSVPADMDNLQEGSFIRMFALNVGDTSTNDTGLAGYLDKVVLATTNETTTYDFEAVDPSTKDDCKKADHHFGFRNQGLCIQFVNTGKDSRNR